MYLFLPLYICITIFQQSRLDNYAKQALGPKTNFFSWCARQSLDDCLPDGGTVMMLSKFLKRNITIVSPEDMWSAEDTSTDIVCGYISSGRYIPTAQTAQPEVGTYILIHV